MKETKYVKGVGPLKKLALDEKVDGKGKVRKSCTKCGDRFYAKEDFEAPIGRPRIYCANCRVKAMRKSRKVYDAKRRSKQAQAAAKRKRKQL